MLFEARFWPGIADGSTLRLIGERPGVVSTELAETLGRERFDFELDVRKLKAMGLTESLTTGYRLSPRGAAFVRPASRDSGPRQG